MMFPTKEITSPRMESEGGERLENRNIKTNIERERGERKKERRNRESERERGKKELRGKDRQIDRQPNRQTYRELESGGYETLCGSIQKAAHTPLTADKFNTNTHLSWPYRGDQQSFRTSKKFKSYIAQG